MRLNCDRKRVLQRKIQEGQTGRSESTTTANCAWNPPKLKLNGSSAKSCAVSIGRKLIWYAAARVPMDQSDSCQKLWAQPKPLIHLPPKSHGFVIVGAHLALELPPRSHCGHAMNDA